MVNSLMRIVLGLLLLGAAAELRAEVVLAVPDAGMLRVATRGGQATVCLAGLMSPPAGSIGSEAARRRLASLVLGRDVRLQRIGRSRGGEELARVSLHGTDVGAALVAEGYARVAAGSNPRLVRLEQIARAHKRGLWATAADRQAAHGTRSYGLIKVIIN